MPPYLPVISINRSQNIRLGAGVGNRVPNELDMGDTVTFEQTGNLFHALHADLGQGSVRRDLQRHSAIGAILEVGDVTTKFTDLIVPSGGAVTGGTGFALNVSAGYLQSRIFGGTLGFAAQVVTPAAPSTYDRVDTVVVQSNGTVAIKQGAPATAAATYEVDSIAVTGTPTGGSFLISFAYNGVTYTISVPYNSSASALNTQLGALVPALPASLTATGGALPGTALTLTASSAFEGPITNQAVVYNGLTGGTTPAATFTVTTAGVGAVPPALGGNDAPLAQVYIPHTATSHSNYVITTITETA